MNDAQLLARFRRFLFGVAALICAVTPVELILAEHYQEPMQWVPLALCALGAAALGAVLWRPARGTLLALRLVAVPLMLGSLLGVWEHFEGNLAFVRETKSALPFGDQMIGALHGRDPMLAPGILALAAVLALAATYRHPATGKLQNS